MDSYDLCLGAFLLCSSNKRFRIVLYPSNKCRIYFLSTIDIFELKLSKYDNTKQNQTTPPQKKTKKTTTTKTNNPKNLVYYALLNISELQSERTKLTCLIMYKKFNI